MQQLRMKRVYPFMLFGILLVFMTKCKSVKVDGELSNSVVVNGNNYGIIRPDYSKTYSQTTIVNNIIHNKGISDSISEKIDKYYKEIVVLNSKEQNEKSNKELKKITEKNNIIHKKIKEEKLQLEKSKEALNEWEKLGKLNSNKIALKNKDTIWADNSLAFLSAIKNNTIIYLTGNEYNITPSLLNMISTKNVVFDELQEYMVLQNVENLSIIGTTDSLSHILTNVIDAKVLSFENCKNILLKNIKVGHNGPKVNWSYCGSESQVLYFEKCYDIIVENSELYGCGSIGMHLNDVTNIEVKKSKIYDCSEAILYIENSKEVGFNDCVFYDNIGSGWRGNNLISVSNTDKVTFLKTLIKDNKGMLTEGYMTKNYSSLINSDQNSNIELYDCEFSKNEVDFFAQSSQSIILTESTYNDNIFRERFYNNN